MKILYVANYYEDVGAISGQVALLQQHIQQEQVAQATIFSTVGSPLKRMGLFFRLFSVAKSYDMIHAHGCSFWGFLPIVYGFLVAKMRKKRIITTYHGGDAQLFFQRTKWVTKVLKDCDTNIVQSAFLQKIFNQYAIPVVVVPNIIEVLPEPIAPQKIEPNFLSVRKLDAQYNVFVILQIFQAIATDYPQATLTILGDGKQRKMLENWAKKHQINAHFVGKVPNSAIYDYHKQCSFLLNTSLVDNMPISLMEAMNSGLVVISGDTGGIPCLIENEKNGLLGDANDVKSMLQKTLWALQNPQKCEQIRQNARQTIQKYQWSEVKNAFFAIYRL